MDFAGKAVLAATAVTSAVIGYLVGPLLWKKDNLEFKTELYKYDNDKIIDYYVSVTLSSDLELDEYVKNKLRNRILNGDKSNVIIRPLCHSDVCKNSNITISQSQEKKDELVLVIKAVHNSGILSTLMNLVEDSFRNISFASGNCTSIKIKYKSQFINREISVENKIPAN